MSQPTVRVNSATRDKLRRLSEATGKSMPDLLASSVDALERDLFLDRANDAFAALRADPDLWSEELEERRAWEGTVGDGSLEEK